jgi:hypothetical protein
VGSNKVVGWLVFLMEKVGLAWNLVRYPTDLIEKGRLQMARKEIDKQTNGIVGMRIRHQQTANNDTRRILTSE